MLKLTIDKRGKNYLKDYKNIELNYFTVITFKKKILLSFFFNIN